MESGVCPASFWSALLLTVMASSIIKEGKMTDLETANLIVTFDHLENVRKQFA